MPEPCCETIFDRSIRSKIASRVLKRAIILGVFWGLFVGSRHLGLPGPGPEVRELWTSLSGVLFGFTLPFALLRLVQKSPERYRGYDSVEGPFVIPCIMYCLDIFYGGMACHVGYFFALVFLARQKDMRLREGSSNRSLDGVCSPSPRRGVNEAVVRRVGVVTAVLSSFIRPQLSNSFAIATCTALLTLVMAATGVYALIHKRRGGCHWFEPYVFLACAPLALGTGTARLLHLLQ
jgi:ABC-type Fe3+ transport system permease subunit